MDWDYNGGTFTTFTAVKDSPNPAPENRAYFRKTGLTWSRRSQKGFSVRPVPAGTIFGDKGPMIFVASDAAEDLDRFMAYLNSGLAAALLEAMVAFGSYEVGAVQRLASVDPGAEAGRLARELTEIRMSEGQRPETDHLFVSPWAGGIGEIESALKVSQEVDETVARAAGEHEGARPLSGTYPTRWFDEDYDPPSIPTAHQELSYLLGVAFGRWDVRIASGDLKPPPLPGPYDLLPPASRGMLVGEDGFPPHQPPGGLSYSYSAPRLAARRARPSGRCGGRFERVIQVLETAPDAPGLVTTSRSKGFPQPPSWPVLPRPC